MLHTHCLACWTIAVIFDALRLSTFSASGHSVNTVQLRLYRSRSTADSGSDSDNISQLTAEQRTTTVSEIPEQNSPSQTANTLLHTTTSSSKAADRIAISEMRGLRWRKKTLVSLTWPRAYGNEQIGEWIPSFTEPWRDGVDAVATQYWQSVKLLPL